MVNLLHDKKVLFIEARNFGDAIIKRGIIDAIMQDDPTVRIDILTKPQLKDIFEIDNSKIEHVYTTSIPIAGIKSWNLLALLKTIWRLRKEHYDVAIDNVGDFRERLILWLAAPKEVVSVYREKGHIFNNLVKSGMSFLTTKVCIREEIVNCYEQNILLLNYFGIKASREKPDVPPIKRVGVHPFASMRCKSWGWEKWEILIRDLLGKGIEVTVFCTMKERDAVLAGLSLDICECIKIQAGSIRAFFQRLKKMDLLIGLDSFSAHAAYYCRVPNIMINGANNYKVWHPPFSRVIASDGGCEYWPCYNKPRCDDYNCINSISVAQVLSNVTI